LNARALWATPKTKTVRAFTFESARGYMKLA
jgi:hypothetical protein